jgi:hypothetical protein
MPGRKSYLDTTRQAARNRAFGRWPARGDANRLEPVPRPLIAPSFRIATGGKVFTIGSCFARNVEEQLAEYQFHVPVMAYRGGPEEAKGHRPQGILNKYSVASIAQEFDWVSSVRASGGIVRWEHVEPLAYAFGEDDWLDLHLASPERVTRARLLERRQQIYDIHVQAFDADLVIITPGVTECWFDAKAGLYVQQMPPVTAAREDAGRFWHEVMDYPTCRDLLDRTVTGLLTAGVKNILMTVSPVPLGRTMTDRDVLVANTHSKSTLRAAVGDVCAAHPEIDYFPSYEIVTLCRDPKIWIGDLVHLQNWYVAGIVKEMLRHYTTLEIGESGSLVTAFNDAFARKDFAECRAVYGRIKGRGLDSSMARFHKNAAAYLRREHDWEGVIAHAKRFQDLCPKKPHGYLIEARAQAAIGRDHEAEAALERGGPHVRRAAKLDGAMVRFRADVRPERSERRYRLGRSFRNWYERSRSGWIRVRRTGLDRRGK